MNDHYLSREDFDVKRVAMAALTLALCAGAFAAVPANAGEQLPTSISVKDGRNDLRNGRDPQGDRRFRNRLDIYWAKVSTDGTDLVFVSRHKDLTAQNTRHEVVTTSDDHSTTVTGVQTSTFTYILGMPDPATDPHDGGLGSTEYIAIRDIDNGLILINANGDVACEGGRSAVNLDTDRVRLTVPLMCLGSPTTISNFHIQVNQHRPPRFDTAQMYATIAVPQPVGSE